MLEINEGVVFVRGAKKGAIYNFNDGKVYWISKESCDLIEKLGLKTKTCPSLTKEEHEYINQLEDCKLFSKEYTIHPYTPNVNARCNLELAWLEITQACNCSCIHCYQGNDHLTAYKALELNDWKNIILELEQLNVSRVVVIGGEPCVHKYIYEILQELFQKKIKTTLFTNATCISEHLMELLIKNRNILDVKVSLYGSDAETHDMITQNPGSFKKLVSNVKYMTAHGISVGMAVVAMRENQNKLDDIRDFSHSLGASYSKFDVIRNVFGGTQDQHTPTDPNIIRSVMFCKPHFKASQIRFDKNCYQNSCWYGKIAVTENGDVLPCVFERNIVYGNVLTEGLTKILNSEAISEKWFMHFGFIEYCKDCEFRYSCKDCRPLGISVNGRISTQNPRCKYNPYTGEWGDGFEKNGL